LDDTDRLHRASRASGCGTAADVGVGLRLRRRPERVLICGPWDTAWVHPIERLRYVARATGAPVDLLASETAGALMGFAHEPNGLVTACKRIVERQPGSAAIVYLAAHALVSPQPARDLREAVNRIEADQTAHAVGYELPDDARITVVGQQRRVATGLFSRGDAIVRVVDTLGEGADLAWQLSDYGVEADIVRPEGVGAAVRDSDLVLIEASAAGPTEAMSITGAFAAAAIAKQVDVPVWLVAGVGTFLPQRMWDGLVARCDGREDPWDRDDEIVPLDLIESVIGPKGRTDVAAAVRAIDCPVAPELFG